MLMFILVTKQLVMRIKMHLHVRKITYEYLEETISW